MSLKTAVFVFAISFAVNGVLCDENDEVRDLKITVDNILELYIDGALIPNLPNYNNWQLADTVPLKYDVQVIAVKGTNSEDVAGILASTDDGYIQTNSSWKCTNVYYEDWQNIDFDDSTWQDAYQVAIHQTSPWSLVDGISTDVYWIWTSPESYGVDPVVYCRKDLPPYVPTTAAPTTAAPTIAAPTTIAPKCPSRTLSIAVDNVMALYIGGVQIQGLPNYKNWRKVDTVPLSCSARVIAVKGTDKGQVAGVIAATGDGYVLTDSTWKCTNVFYQGWEQEGFDDSTWPAAVRQKNIHTKPAYALVPGLGPGAFWIWTARANPRVGDKVVYCRKDLYPEVPPPPCWSKDLSITVDNYLKLFIDGVEQTNLPNANYWPDSDTVELSCTNQVIAVQGTDDGTVSAGILASTSDGYVLTNDSWKCTSVYYEGWEQVGYDDSDWLKAYIVAIHVTSPYSLVSPIRTDAYWIWTGPESNGSRDTPVYCRKRLQG